MTERRNVYTCPNGHQTQTVDRDDGVTAFLVGCPAPGCAELARSSFYCDAGEGDPTHEWFKPADVDAYLETLEPGARGPMRDHFDAGGLAFREIPL